MMMWLLRDKGNSTMRDKRDNMKDKTGFAIWYEKTVGKLIPKQTVISLISCFVLNSVIYTGTQILMKNAKHYDLSTKFDKELPFVKEWIYVYLICFAFWAVNYIMISRTKKEHWYKFATGDYMWCVFYIASNDKCKTKGYGKRTFEYTYEIYIYG